MDGIVDGHLWPKMVASNFRAKHANILELTINENPFLLHIYTNFLLLTYIADIIFLISFTMDLVYFNKTTLLISRNIFVFWMLNRWFSHTASHYNDREMHY